MAERTFNEQLARTAVGGYDDAQDVRTAMMNRIRDVVRKKNEGIPFDETEDEKEEDSFDSKYDDDNLEDLLEEMLESGDLSRQEHSYLSNMMEAAELASEMEDKFEKTMMAAKNEPIYDEWLDHVYGVSHVLTARLVYLFGYCEKFPKVSNLWSYCGLAPGQERTQGEQISYNPEAKTKAWLVADRIIMQGDNSVYKTEFYDPYKKEQVRRMENSSCTFCGEPTYEHKTSAGVKPCEEYEQSSADDWGLQYFTIHGKDVPEEATPPWTQGHADNRARRYLAKKFLKHYWAISRDMKGLETPDEWVITHGGHEKKIDTWENPFYAKSKVKHM